MASFCQKSSVLFHPTAKERKINMFRSIIRCKVYFETHVKCMCKKACAGIVALRAVLGHNQIGVYDDVKQIFKMAPTPRKTKKGTSRHFATPRSAFFPQYFKSCDLRQWGISDVKKNGVQWTFVRSLELKRPKTRVFLLNNLPDKVQKNLNKEDVRFWYLEIFFAKYTCWWWCVWCSAKLFHTVLCFY